MKAARGDRYGNARQLDIDAEWRGIERADAEISRVAEGKIDGVRDKARLSPFVFGEDLIRNGDTGGRERLLQQKACAGKARAVDLPAAGKRAPLALGRKTGQERAPAAGFLISA